MDRYRHNIQQSVEGKRHKHNERKNIRPALARSDQPKDCTVTSSLLINILLRHSYSDVSATLMLLSFSWQTREISRTNKKPHSITYKRTTLEVLLVNGFQSLRLCTRRLYTRLCQLTHWSWLRVLVSTGSSMIPVGSFWRTLFICKRSTLYNKQVHK